jgi:hypothetical protein
MHGRWSLAGVCLLGASTLVGCGDKAPTDGGNSPPRIVSVSVSPGSVILNGEARAAALVSDPDRDVLTVRWSATGGHFLDSSKTSTTWKAPNAPGLFTLSLTVSDGQESVSDSVEVMAGNVAITVLSDPPGAYIVLDGNSTGLAAPHTFDPLPAGYHSASLFSPYYRYEGPPGREMAHGDRDTLRFDLIPAISKPLDPLRADLVEIGGIAFLPGGLGVVYVARTASETALYSTPLYPAAGTPRDVRLLVPVGVRIEEPIAMGTTGPDLFFVTADDSLAAMAIRDLNQDGVVDSVGTVKMLRRAYAPAVSRDGSSQNEKVAFGFSPSEDPPALQIFWGVYSGGTLSTLQSATPHSGKLATWKPGEDIVAYVRNDAIFRSAINPGNLPQADTLFSGGVNTAPCWGPWGAKTLAFLHGEDGGPYTELVLTAMGAPDAVTVHTGLSDPRFVAWSPFVLERAVAITHHPGGTPQILIVRGLPVP